MHLRQNLAGVAQIILNFYLFVFQALEDIQGLFFVPNGFWHAFCDMEILLTTTSSRIPEKSPGTASV